MASAEPHIRARSLRLLALVALLVWVAAAISAFIDLPWWIAAIVATLGLGLTFVVWQGLGVLADAAPATAAIGAPAGAFEVVDPNASFERESDEIERLREIENELRGAKLEAEAATLAKGEFLATMSHEIRTPLNGIVPLIDVVLSSPLNSDQRQCLETAYSSAQQLLSIVDDILDYSKIEANRLELESIGVNLRELVDSVAQLMAHPAQAKGVALNVRFDPQLRPILRGDPVRLRQLLTNLISNAVKFTERGSVTVQVSRRGETATHTQVLFAIVDSGVGISEAAQTRLFQPFTQADNSVTRVFGGTGLGLAICRRLVEVMGGEIGVKSSTGQGSTFWFSVPLLKAPGDIETPAHGVEGTRALVVSADQVLVRELGAFFTAAGIQHTHTSLSADAVSRLRGNPNAPRGMQSSAYQFVFLDWSGMRLTAQSMARGLLRDAALSHLRIVLLAQPQDDVPDDLRQHAQVLIHPRVFEASKLRAALDSDGAAPVGLRTIDDLLRDDDRGDRDAMIATTIAARRPAARRMPTGPTTEGDAAASALDGLASDRFIDVRLGGVASGSPRAASEDFAPSDAASPAVIRRVLLVEDNPVNRQVAQRLLSIGGLTVDVAEDGAVAFAQRFVSPPLAILMDCQMPVMDGYASTRAIREREAREGLPRMPIIAMTANAMLGDREKCLQAGMDDYLSKPLDRKALAQTLERWLAVSEGRTTVMAKRRELVSLDGDADAEPVTARAAADSAPPRASFEGRAPLVESANPFLQSATRAAQPVAPPAPIPSSPAAPSPGGAPAATRRALDTEVIDDLIDMMGDDFGDLVRIYLHDAPVHVAEVRAAAQRNDLAGLAPPAHILKSSSANLGAMLVSALAREIETSARQGQLPRAALQMADELERAYVEASVELSRLISLRNA